MTTITLVQAAAHDANHGSSVIVMQIINLK